MMTKRIGWLAAASVALLAAVAVLIGGHAVHAAPAAALQALVLNDDATTQWAMHSTKGRTNSHQRVHYHGHSLVRLTPARAADLPALHQLLLDLNIDVWSALRGQVDVRAADAHVLKQALDRYLPGVRARTLVADVEKQLLEPHWHAIDERVAVKSVAAQLHDPKSWFAEYHHLDEIYEWYQLLAAAHKDRITLMRNVGTTHEGRELMALRFTNHSSTNVTLPKKQVYVQGGIHAREWIAHATTQYIAYHLATSDDQTITSLLDEVEIVLVPIVNPDGYAYSWTGDRLWRKNRRADARGVFGVDLNRNYPSHWGEAGASKFRFSDTYMGPSPGSEPEVQALMALFDSLPRVVAALDLHAFSQAILHPPSWTLTDTVHEPQLKAMGDAMSQIIKSVHGKDYVSERLVDLYPHSATGTDWWYDQSRPLDNLAGKRGVDAMNMSARKTVFRPYSFTIELRPSQEDTWQTGGSGFILDKREIIPVGEEILPAFLYYARTALDNVLIE
ncbi:hypothetical protein AMAG_06939 [Allomyces macrogynus ATCC 38327]|uniref:Peptidase M14 domain-containing protein n=1 Tax=Allomyces macrogynus (strain ATCC 38327) TaxID=578462 RepID=A0A0L0SFH7_ALLM3|nr:hypothetical protein AMAG_06939 [Allomyces macrogynus ATCC 38327]|eukprot:KNE61189.1 hypothetical protein AMAG_06939 [Allomyces macrogynus ATCC 38327]